MTVNVELLQKTLDTIKANPEHWKQSSWHCDTSHCFAGFAELLHYNLPINTSEEDLVDDPRFYDYIGKVDWKTSANATKLLGLRDDDAEELFAGYNTLEDLERMVAELTQNGTLQEDEDDDEE